MNIQVKAVESTLYGLILIIGLNCGIKSWIQLKTRLPERKFTDHFCIFFPTGWCSLLRAHHSRICWRCHKAWKAWWNSIVNGWTDSPKLWYAQKKVLSKPLTEIYVLQYMWDGTWATKYCLTKNLCSYNRLNYSVVVFPRSWALWQRSVTKIWRSGAKSFLLDQSILTDVIHN